MTGKPFDEITEADVRLLKKFEKKMFKHLDKDTKPTVKNSFKQLVDIFTDASFAGGTEAMVRGLAQNEVCRRS